MYDVPRRKKLRDRCAEPWKRKGAAVSGFPSLPRLSQASGQGAEPTVPPGVCRYHLTLREETGRKALQFNHQNLMLKMHTVI